MQREESKKSSKNLISNFDYLLSKPFQKISKTHWTPIKIAEIAAKWLGEKATTKVLDIGSGVGKFCMVGASLTQASFTGIEKRKNLVDEAELIAKKLQLSKVQFINKNIVDLSFEHYNAFYYYNPFCEYIALADKIDNSILFSEKQLKEYNNYVFSELKKKPKGTRFVTYFSPNFFLPDTYIAKEILENGKLVFWEKKN